MNSMVNVMFFFGGILCHMVNGVYFPSVRNFDCGFQRVLLNNHSRVSWCMQDTSFKVLVQAKTTGWVGIGFTPVNAKNIVDADVVAGYVDDAGSAHISDMFGTGDGAVEDTSVGGEYSLTEARGWEENGWTTITFLRQLTNADAKDRAINMKLPIPIVVSYGDGDSLGNAFDAKNTEYTFLIPYSSLSTFPKAEEYRTMDGSGNNVEHPTWGVTGDYYTWKNKNGYEDGISTPAGPNRPTVRNISNVLFSRSNRVQNGGISGWGMYFGHFMSSDISKSSTSKLPEDVSPIVVPECDAMFDPGCAGATAIGFKRAAWLSGTGTNTSNPRLHKNAQTGYLDASIIYGYDDARAAPLRSNVEGKLLLDDHGLLPKVAGVGMASFGACPCDTRSAGDKRANAHTPFMALNIVFIREHNRWCDILHSMYPEWDDEVLYQEARRRVIAIWQKISMYEYLSAVIGEPTTLWSAYNPNIPARVTHELNVCAFRYGHSELAPTIPRVDREGKEIPEGHLELEENIFQASEGIANNDIDSVLRGVARLRPGKADTRMISTARNKVFANPRGSVTSGIDLASLSMKRCRDVGIRDFNSVRVDYGLPAISSWEELVKNDPDTVEKLKLLYPDVNDADLYVGGLAEEPTGASTLGALYKRILETDMKVIRDADRFWFENNQFSKDELTLHRRMVIFS